MHARRRLGAALAAVLLVAWTGTAATRAAAAYVSQVGHLDRASPMSPVRPVRPVRDVRSVHRGAAGRWSVRSAAQPTAPETRSQPTAPETRSQPQALETPSQPPAPGPVVRAFAPPAHPFGPGHRGVDLAVAPGTEIRAALAGVVAFAGQVAGAGWVTLDHGGGLQTTYGSLSPIAVRPGAVVDAGTVLGRLAPGEPVLHWGARLDGAYIDPLGLLSAGRVHLTGLRR